MASILVTGGAGFIGGNFVREVLRATDWRVVNLDALTYAGHRASLGGVLSDPRHVFVHGRLEDQALVASLLAAHDPIAVVNFAAETHVDRSIEGPGAFVGTNVVGTQVLLDAARAHWAGLPAERRRTFRFLQISTDEVFGSLGPSGHFTESSPYRPNSPYAATKAAADHLARAYHHTYGLPTLVTHCSNNYGPYQYPEKLIPHILFRALREQALPIYGDGRQVRDWLHVADHCRALLRVLSAAEPGASYAIGGNNEHTNLEVVHEICKLLDERIPGRRHAELITYVADRPGHDRRYAIDASRLSAELGWSPACTFAAGLRETVDWYLANLAWCEAVTEQVYKFERLGLV